MLAKFEPGDLMLLSDIMDSLKGMRDLYSGSPVGQDFIERTLAWIAGQFKGAQGGDFHEKLSLAIELLQKCEGQSTDAARARIEGEMQGFALGNFEAAHPGPTDETKPIPVKTQANAFLREESVALFISEAKERLSQAQELVLILEASPNDAGSLAALFRAFHTIKGECGFMHFSHLGELTHSLENVLDLLRGGKLALTRSVVDLLLGGIDRSHLILENIAEGDWDTTVGPELSAYLVELGRCSSRAQPSLGDVLIQSGKLDEGRVEEILSEQRSGSFSQRFGEIAVKEALISSGDLRQALVQQSMAAAIPDSEMAEPGAAESQQDEIIKVRIDKVNFLVDMIGELTIALGQVSESSVAMAQVRKITRSLQVGAMELRTDTMHGLFSTAKRIVRDLSHSLEKQVGIHSEGEDLEVDRHLIKKLEEPLMHLVRNALDHGIDASGSIRIAAVRRGSTIEITVEDDGRGLDREAILAKALERSLVVPQAAASLSDNQVFDFIFQPGFSTKASATQVSGRGVGLDIVKSMVKASRGTISIRTAPGKGTAFIMTFPISTAIIDGLVVKVGDNTLIIPTSSVVELLKVKDSQLSRVNGDIELITLREKVMPVLRLDRVLGIGGGRDAKYLVGIVVENSEHIPHFLVIDEVVAKREVVVKPLGPRFRKMRGITAGTVLPGGTIGLVIDVEQLINLALQTGGARPAQGAKEAAWK